MQAITGIVRPDKVDDVKDALAQLGVSGMAVTEVRGHGKQKGHLAMYRGREYPGRDDESVGMDVSQHGEEAYVRAEGAAAGV